MNGRGKRFLGALHRIWKSHERKFVPLVFLFTMLSSTAVYGENQSGFSLVFSGGMHVGGITRAEPIDAVSSASKWEGHGGVHAEMDIAGHFLETGLDYFYLKKDLDYEDTDKNIDGTRSFTAHGIALPVLYNFRFLKRGSGDPSLVLGVGLTGFLFPYQEIKDTGTVSVSDSKNWAAGPCIRISYYPLELKGKYSPGLYLSLFRSFSRFYIVDDEDSKAGELAIIGIGISLKIKP
jgi:hypothetical protein